MRQLFIILRLFLLIFFFFCVHILLAQEIQYITVAADGSGDFTTVTAALRSLPVFNYQRTEIFVKNGIYNEKIRIDQDYITLRGESREKTILQYRQLRKDWEEKKDSIGPGVINIFGDDFILENMTVGNTQTLTGEHAFAIYGTGTRIIILNSNIISKGGDTVALWNYKTGMYYHANCYFEGAVDFVCPRGWCYIRDSKFYEVRKTASIWHAGGDNISQKLVIRNCGFDGVKGFHLGRHHYEAQFYLLDCFFSGNMENKPIYRVTYPDNAMNRPFNWGPRYYFYNCRKEGEEFSWIRDNLHTAGGSLLPGDITPLWTFDNKWNPESSEGPEIISYQTEGNSITLAFDEKITVSGSPVLHTDSGETLKYESGGGSNTIRFTSSQTLRSNYNKLRLTGGQLTGTTASVMRRIVSFDKIQSPRL